MKKASVLKRIAAAAAVLVLCGGVFSSERAQGVIGVCADESSEEEQESAPEENIYVSRLGQIAARQEELKNQLEGANSDILSESEKQTIILEQINMINEKSEVLNAYMTSLEMNISAEQREVLGLKKQVDEGIANYKQRLRTMYIMGDLSYADVVINSGSFFDVLMRTELMKRLTEQDAERLDELVAMKSEYDSSNKQLMFNESEYTDQMKQLEREKAELASLYNSSGETKRLLREKMDKLAEDEKVFENEIYSYEGILNDLLLGTYSSDADETFRLETEVKATDKLTELHKQISDREQAGEKLADTESRYRFMWPVKEHTYVSSGVGARWGTYHTGLDIPGESAFPISASEAGTVVRTNNSCTHNYGKDGSCGCGGGYGNFVIIDHGNGFLTLYGHLTTTKVEVGDKVKKGDTIGLMGSTGYSTGTHLHFELRYEGYVTNPANFVTPE